MYTVIGTVRTRAARVLWMLEELGLPYTHVAAGPRSDGVTAFNPAGKVPVLKVEGETIWDSLAISVWTSERFPNAGLWPSDPHARWLARSVVCEMHSSFMALRTECGMGPDANGVIHTMVGPDRAPTPASEAVATDVRRLVEIIRTMRTRFGAGGPYLFGAWSMPDAFLTPVAARFRHYQFDLAAYDDDGIAATYVAELLQQPDFLEWSELAVTKRP